VKILLVLLFITTYLFGEKSVSIASYNVENLFDLHTSGYEYEEYLPNTQSLWNTKNYKKKLQNISRVIYDLDADILALQEIESLEVLKDLRYTLKQKGLYYQYYAIADKKNTTVKVAVLSRLPFTYAKELQVGYNYKYRNILELKFLIEKQELYLFINHWKSKGGPESERIYSAKVLRKRLKELGEEKNIILTGDFNSHYEENKIFLHKRRHNDTDGQTGINHILNTTKQTTSVSNIQKHKGALYNLWYDKKEDLRYSYIYKKEKEALDNIIVTQSLLEKKGIFYKEGSMSHFAPPYLLQNNKINRWKTRGKKPRKHQGKGYSDHLPIKAEFIISD